MTWRDKRLLSTNAIIFAFQDACKKIPHFINPFKKLLNLKITDISAGLETHLTTGSVSEISFLLPLLNKKRFYETTITL